MVYFMPNRSKKTSVNQILKKNKQTRFILNIICNPKN